MIYKRIVLLSLGLIIINGCASRNSDISRFYRECDGRVSYVMCPSPPRSYQAAALNKNGTLAQLSEKETQAMSILTGQDDANHKAAKLQELGYSSRSGAYTLEFVLCSQYATCELSREQYAQIRQTILPIVEKN